MKKTILAIIAVMLIIFAMSSACLTSYTQSTRETLENSDDNQKAMNTETIEDGEKTREDGEANASYNQEHNVNDAEEPENMQSVTSNDSPQNPADTSQNENTWTDICPPDGRIYWTPEPPYAYVPTYTPKEWTGLPIMPPELEN